MGKTEFESMVDMVLCRMKEESVSPKQLKEYRQTGFGAIRKHFEAVGQSYYSTNIIDSFVLQTRNDRESGNVSDWKWHLVRRGGELLKHFHEHGNLELPPCAKWEILHDRCRIEPSAKEFADKGNIYALAWNVKRELELTGYSARTLEHYQREGFDRILRYCGVKGESDYSAELVNEMVAQAEKTCVKREFCTLRRAANLLEEFYETGSLKACHLKRVSLSDDHSTRDHSNIRGLMNLALQKMEHGGATPKALKRYRTTGFGGIVRYFEAIAQPQYSAEIIDSFVWQTRGKLESGRISRDTWGLVRRGGEIMKLLHDNGTIELPPCAKWEVLHNPLHREPTAEEATNPSSVVALVRRTEQLLARLGLAPKTISNYKYDGFDRILRRHFELGLTDYSPEVVDDITTGARLAYEAGTMARSIYQDVRKIADILTTFHMSGKCEPKRIGRYGLRQLRGEFEALIQEFCFYARRTGFVKEGTVRQVKCSVRGFLFELEDIGIYTFGGVTRRLVSECITHLAERFAGGLNAMLFGVRIFLRHLHSRGVTDDDLSIAIPEFVAPRRVIREGFCCEVIDKLLAAADTTTTIGKRDYAIMLLGKQTGLRACDVTKLKRENIDWRLREIRIVQVKTEVPLTLPLPVESGNAIADYLLEARPDNNSPYIFLSTSRPHNPLSTVGTIMRRYIKKAGVCGEIAPRSGFHSFRRAYGRHLLEAQTSLDMLGELLGQLDMDSAKPYVATDEKGLKRCALGLASVKKAGDTI